MIGKKCERGFWGAGKDLFLDQGDGFMDIGSLRNSSSDCTYIP